MYNIRLPAILFIQTNRQR